MTKRKWELPATEYGSAANGTHVGSGYDVEIEIEDRELAHATITHLASKRTWSDIISIDPGEDLQKLAVEIGNNPGPWIEEMEESE